MERFEEAVPLYLKACEVEGKTERTVQSYAETLRHFIRAVDQLQLPISVRAFRPAHVYLFMGWHEGSHRFLEEPSQASAVEPTRA